MEDLTARLGHPERGPRLVHVGGTKGKGSVAALVASALTATGKRVGVYASPHVERVTERVRIDGEEVDDLLLAAGLEAALEALRRAEEAGTGGAAATWFDLMTAGALWALREARVDWGVIEVGLGGRLDSTNVVSPELCVLTTIDLEHTDVLGDTTTAIAAEKAGILKRGVELVCGVERDSPAGNVIARRAAELEIDPRWVPPRPTPTASNAALARAALEALGLPADLADDPQVRARAVLPGRLERARLGATPVVLDGAHVPSSLRAVLAELAADPELAGPCVGVFGAGLDKDAAGLLKALAERADRVHCTSVATGRQRAAEELRALAAQEGLDAEATEPAEEAVASAAAAASPRGWVLVTGSLHLIGAVRGALSITRHHE